MPRAHRVRLVAALALCTSGLARADGRELFLREEGAVGEAPEGAVLPSITPDAADQSPVVAREAILRARELFLASSFQEATRVLLVAIDATIDALLHGRRELAVEILHWAGACALLGENRDAARDLFRRALSVAPTAQPPVGTFPPTVEEFFNVVAQEVQTAGSAQHTFRTVPSGARIEVDGRPEGLTPVTPRLTPGVHYVTLQRLGYRRWAAPVAVPVGVNGHEIVLSEATGAELRAQVGRREGLTEMPDAPTLNRLLTEYGVARVTVLRRDGALVHHPPLRAPVWPWIAAGGAVVAVGVGLTVYFLALQPPPEIRLVAP